MTRRQYETLARAGLTEAEMARKVPLFERARAAIPSPWGQLATALWFVPGRIEILGKHTDYAGGRSLLAAAERGFCLAAVPRTDSTVGCTDAVTMDRVELCLGGADSSVAIPGWGTYAAAVVRRVGRNFEQVRRGTEIAFASDLPPAAGMSSSSALIVGLFLALSAANDLEHDPLYESVVRSGEDLAGYLATIENGMSFGALTGDRGVGTFGGSEDHTAILLSERGRARQYAFCPTRLERTITLPIGMTFAIAASGVEAPKTGSARDSYNRASRAARRVLEIWNHATGRRFESLGQACAQAPGAVGELMRVVASSEDAEFGRDQLIDRLTQFVEESFEILPRAGDALSEGDTTTFGSLVARSQSLAETKLGNQTPETVALAGSARDLGALAATAFGAGFGGSVWALVEAGQAASFLDRWQGRYHETFPARAADATFFLTGAGPGAFRVE